MNEKRLTAAFRTFVDKVFLPTMKRTDPQALEWHKFSRLLSGDTINLEEITQYVDSLNGSPGNLGNFPGSLEKKEMPFMRKKAGEDLGPSHSEPAFNPSKTFGGERARMMFMKGEMDDNAEKREGFNSFGMGSRADDSGKRGFNSVSGQTVLPGLERLCKQFL